MTSCFGESLLKIKDGDFGANMTDLYNHECYEGFLEGELNFKIHVSSTEQLISIFLQAQKRSLRGSNQ